MRRFLGGESGPEIVREVGRVQGWGAEQRRKSHRNEGLYDLRFRKPENCWHLQRSGDLLRSEQGERNLRAQSVCNESGERRAESGQSGKDSGRGKWFDRVDRADCEVPWCQRCEAEI